MKEKVLVSDMVSAEFPVDRSARKKLAQSARCERSNVLVEIVRRMAFKQGLAANRLHQTLAQDVWKLARERGQASAEGRPFPFVDSDIVGLVDRYAKLDSQIEELEQATPVVL